MLKHPKYFLFIALILLIPSFLIGSCSTGETTQSPGGTVTSSPIQNNTPVTETQQSPTASPSPVNLLIWVPDNLVLRNQDEIITLLENQTKSFIENHPEVSIDIRIKSTTGPSNLMDSLQSTSLAAPEALPDIVLLSRSDMEVAALKGLLIPFDGVSDLLSANDWLASIKQLANIQGSVFGFPVVSDALVYFVNKDEVHQQNTFLVSKPLLGYLNDPSAAILMGLYLSAGGKLVDQDGRATLENPPLISALKEIENARKSGAFPPWIMDITNQEDVYRYYQADRGQRMLAWYGDLPASTREALAVEAIPGIEGRSASLVDGWFWTMAQPKPDNRQLTVELIESLTNEAFLAEMARASGFIPVRLSPSVVEDIRLNQIAEITSNSQPIPDGLFLVTISPTMQEAIQSLFSNSALTVEEIALSAKEKIQIP